MSLGGILLGIINVAIVVAVLMLIGAIILWLCSWMQIGVPLNVQRGYIAVVALIALYLIVALLLGLPGIRVIGSAESQFPAIGAMVPAPPDIAVAEAGQ
jgi:hypothetical protein